jgi:hypothetical protein
MRGTHRPTLVPGASSSYAREVRASQSGYVTTMTRRIAVILGITMFVSTSVAVAAAPVLTYREARTEVARDLRRHFGKSVKVTVWGCHRRSRTSIRCDTEFVRRITRAICVARLQVIRRSRALAAFFRSVRPLFGTRCRAKHGQTTPHVHPRR